jgi:hypothetical protein
MVSGVDFLSPTGREIAVARLGQYEKVEGKALLMPRLIWIDWPGNKEYLHMSLDQIQVYGQDPKQVFTSPRQRGRGIGKEIRVDRPPTTAAPAPAGGNKGTTAGRR